MKKILIALFAALSLLTLAACGQGAEQLGYISADAARTAALSSAGVSAQAATFTGTDLTDRDGVRYYLVAFTADGASYTSQVDALTGVVIQTESAPLTQSAPAEQVVTAEAAKAKALEHAGLTEADVTFIKAELDRENGRTVYDVEFYTADYKEYDYEIDAASGEILSFDYDAEHYAPSSGSGTDTGDYIGEAEAKRIALAEVSGAADSDVRYARLDWDDGRAEYEVKIVLGTTEYEFEIDAVTGVILSRDSDSIYD